MSIQTDTTSFSRIPKRERVRSEGQEARYGHRAADRERSTTRRQDRGQKRAQAFV